MPLWRAWAMVQRGWVLTQQGVLQEGIAQIREGLDAAQATGAAVYQPYFLALLAEAYGKAGQAEEGLRLLGEALGVAHTHRELYYEAEIHRLRGEFSLQSAVHSRQSTVTNLQSPTPNPQEEAEACFLKAIEIARKQSAKSLELRATMSLSRLWQQQGRKEEARQMLAEIYGWFTEGFDTQDLQEAKALMEELGG
jgi:predicted ATPase